MFDRKQLLQRTENEEMEQWENIHIPLKFKQSVSSYNLRNFIKRIYINFSYIKEFEWLSNLNIFLLSNNMLYCWTLIKFAAIWTYYPKCKASYLFFRTAEFKANSSSYVCNWFFLLQAKGTSKGLLAFGLIVILVVLLSGVVYISKRVMRNRFRCIFLSFILKICTFSLSDAK